MDCNYGELVDHCSTKATQLAIDGWSLNSSHSSGTSVAHQQGGKLCGCIVTVFHPAFQLMPLKPYPVMFAWRSCCSIAHKLPISCCLSPIRSVDVKLFGASARLYFRGTATLLIKALRHVQALSPSASWYCLLKPKEPNNNKHLCCYRLSLSD